MKTMFKVGDRVRTIYSEKDIGTIHEIAGVFRPNKVIWDDKTKVGHWFSDHELLLVKEEVMTFEEFLKEFGVTARIKNQRLGQAFMNTLFTHREDLYTKLTGSNWDCFYNDKTLSDAIKFVMENW